VDSNLIFGLLCSSAALPLGAETYRLTAPATPKQIVEGRLDMGGTSPSGGTIAVNSYYMSIDGRPVIPVMGEFHFSRYPRAQWEEEIVKMKAGGVNVLPTYVFWALHEPREGEFHWDGNLDLRYFLELCRKHSMPVIIRIGPFCHGEMRSGAIPDWIFAKPLEIRSNDPEYLKYVRVLYGQIARQMEGMYYNDGGPVIGCQLENEMQHSAAPWAITYPGEEKDFTAASWNAAEAAIGVEGGHKQASGAEAGNEHMRTLLKMAREAGIVTPFYTATGGATRPSLTIAPSPSLRPTPIPSGRTRPGCRPS
jgi:beta-galactosidase